MRCITGEADVAVNPSLQWKMHSQPPFEYVALRDQVEELLNSRAERFECVKEIGF